MSMLNFEPKGLCRLFRNGIVIPEGADKDHHRGVVMLIKGDPGTGKTTLALQIALTALPVDLPPEDNTNSKCALEPGFKYYSGEQTKTDILRRAREILENAEIIKNKVEKTKKDKKEVVDGFIKMIDISSYIADLNNDISKNRAEPYKSSFDVYNWVDDRIQEIGELEKNLKLVTVLDCMNLLYKEEREMIQVERLMENMRRCCCLGILILDSSSEERPFQEFMADIVIEMKGTRDNVANYLLHKLSITKTRYQETALGWHQYKNGKEGITVYPSIHYWTSQTGSVHKQMEDSLNSLFELVKQQREDKDPAADKPREFDLITQMIGPNSFSLGSCTVLLGPRRTLKTELCLDFLRGQSIGGMEGKALLVTLLDNQGTIRSQCQKLCNYFGAELDNNNSEKVNKVTLSICNRLNTTPRCMQCFNQVHAFYFRPGCIAPEEFMYWLDEEYTILKFQRLVFWDLTQMESRFPLLASESLFLPLLIDWLQNSKKKDGTNKMITSLFMGSPNTQIGKIASAIADNVLFTWRDSRRNSSNKSDRQDGVAVYLDRAQGKASSGGLWWFPDPQTLVPPAAIVVASPNPVQTVGELKSDLGNLVLAKRMIAKIQAMQGFDVAR